MNLFQAATGVDCTDLADQLGLVGRATGNGRGSWQCPFHNDSTPSMVTYPAEGGSKSHFYCFSCKAHGDAVDLYGHVKRLSAKQAAMEICDKWCLSYDVEPARGVTKAIAAPSDDDPRLAVILAVCGEWQKYRIAWYKEQLELAQARLPRMSEGWMRDMEEQWIAFYQQQIRKFSDMTEWEVLHDLRAEFEALGVNPYRRLRIAGTVS